MKVNYIIYQNIHSVNLQAGEYLYKSFYTH